MYGHAREPQHCADRPRTNAARHRWYCTAGLADPKSIQVTFYRNVRSCPCSLICRVHACPCMSVLDPRMSAVSAVPAQCINSHPCLCMSLGLMYPYHRFLFLLSLAAWLLLTGALKVNYWCRLNYMLNSYCILQVIISCLDEYGSCTGDENLAKALCRIGVLILCCYTCSGDKYYLQSYAISTKYWKLLYK